MTIFVAMKKSPSDDEEVEAQLLKGRLESKGKDAILSNQIDWVLILEQEGSFHSACRWIVRNHKSLLLIADNGFLGKGQFDLVNMFLAEGKTVGWVDLGKAERVTGVQFISSKRPKDRYGKVIL